MNPIYSIRKFHTNLLKTALLSCTIHLSIYSNVIAQDKVKSINIVDISNTSISCDSLMKIFNESRIQNEYQKADGILIAVVNHCPENSKYWASLSLNYLESADNSYSGAKEIKK